MAKNDEKTVGEKEKKLTKKQKEFEELFYKAQELTVKLIQEGIIKPYEKSDIYG